MEINKQEFFIPVLSKGYETAVEQGVDTEFALPDYYPEISKILKIISVVNISSTKCDNGSITVGGQTVLTMLYLGSDENLNSFTHYVPFVKNIEVSSELSGIVSVATQINYMNFKAVSPRKVELHGALSLNISVDKITNNNCLSSCSWEGVYTKNTHSVLVFPMVPISKSVFVSDEISVGDGKTSIGKILRNCANVQISECKCVSGKGVIKGEVIIELLCVPSDNGRPFMIKESQMFSQIFDCDAQGEIITFDVFPHIENIELRPKTALDGEVHTVAFEVKVGLDIMGFYAKDISYVSDAFSCKYLADIKKKKLGVEEYVIGVNDKMLCEKEFDFAGVLKDVLDLYCDVKIDYCTLDGQEMIIKGVIPISIIGTDSQGDYGCFEKLMDFEYRYNLSQKPERIRCNPIANVVAVKYNLKPDGTLCLAVELRIEGNVFGISDTDVVVAMDVDLEKIVNAVENAAISLYFAENESPWEIAQKYGVSPDGICEVNSLENIDIKYKGVLLIPCI